MIYPSSQIYLSKPTLKMPLQTIDKLSTDGRVSDINLMTLALKNCRVLLTNGWIVIVDLVHYGLIIASIASPRP